jgi:hypothetical protein
VNYIKVELYACREISQWNPVVQWIYINKRFNYDSCIITYQVLNKTHISHTEWGSFMQGVEGNQRLAQAQLEKQQGKWR